MLLMGNIYDALIDFGYDDTADEADFLADKHH